jgi:hypothetical protein
MKLASLAPAARPGWERQDTSGSAAGVMGRRRWRILQAARPVEADPVPHWIRTPEQFADWLAARLDSRVLRGYFLDLEEIARQSCDLELLRFARIYLGRAAKLRRG